MKFEHYRTQKSSRTTFETSGPGDPLGPLSRFCLMAAVSVVGIGTSIYSGQTPVVTVKKDGIQLSSRPVEKAAVEVPREQPTKSIELTSKLPDNPPLPRSKPVELGYYWEMVRVQGDAYADDEFERVKRRCIPEFRMPQVCYLPQEMREKIFVWPTDFESKDIHADPSRR